MIDGNEVQVLKLERLEYNGEWVPGGYRILLGEGVRWLFGWPSDSDIRNNFPETFFKPKA